MGLFDGLGALGRGLGAAAQGYGKGELAGEQTAYNRLQNQNLFDLKKMLAMREKPVKEDEPLPLKALYDSRSRVVSSNDPTAWQNWQNRGMEDLFQKVNRGYTQGGAKTAMRVYNVANRYEDEPLDELAAAAGKELPYATPSLKRDAPLRYGIVPVATAGNLDSERNARDTKLPFEVQKLQEEIKDFGFNRGQKMREFNWKTATDTFDNWVKRFDKLVGEGQTDAKIQNDLFGKIMDHFDHMQQAAGQAGVDLKPFLVSKTATGELLNGPAARMYLQQRGRSPQEIDTILGGWPKKLDPNGNVLSDVTGGTGAAAPGGGGLPGAQASLQSQGWPISSPIGAGDQHNPGSQHYSGNAFDVGVRNHTPDQVAGMIQSLQSQGFRVVDERQHPPGQGVWTGPHIHVEGARGGQSGPPVLPSVGPGPVAPSGTPSLGDPGAGGMAPGSAPAPNNPHPEGSFEWHTVDALMHGTPGQEIVNQFANAGRPQDAARAAAAIDAFNKRSQGAFFAGQPPIATNGAMIPTPPSPGGLGYSTQDFQQYTGGPGPVTPNPAVPTRPVVNGAYAQQPEVIEEPAPSQPTGGAPVSAPAAPAPTQPAGSIFTMPEGPSLTGMPGGGLSAGPPVTGMPADDAGPRVSAGPGPTLDDSKTVQSAVNELRRYRKTFEYAPGVDLWLKAMKITDPVVQRNVFESVQHSVTDLMKKGTPPAKIKQMISRELAAARGGKSVSAGPRVKPADAAGPRVSSGPGPTLDIGKTQRNAGSRGSKARKSVARG